MASIYQKALGSEFQKLHPKIQERFGFSSEDGIASVGKGVMEKVWKGKFYTLPFLYIGTWRNIMFPASGTDIPFQIENYAYRDNLGRETVTWVRTFYFTPQYRRFDATMIYSQQRNCIVDYLGNRQHLAVDIEMFADEEGGINLRSGEQRFYEGAIAFRFPMFFSGYAQVREWFDDSIQQYRIEVNVRNKRWGPLFGYKGKFEAEFIQTHGNTIPQHVKPLREETRE